MAYDHLVEGVHYRLSITTPRGELLSAHLMDVEGEGPRCSLFLKDEERVDEAVAAVQFVHDWLIAEAVRVPPPGEMKMYIWDWDELAWQLSTLGEELPAQDDDVPF